MAGASFLLRVTMAAAMLLLLLTPASTQQQGEQDESLSNPSFYNGGGRNNSCSVVRDCDLCMRDPECAWCKDASMDGRPRCDVRKW